MFGTSIASPKCDMYFNSNGFDLYLKAIVWQLLQYLTYTCSSLNVCTTQVEVNKCLQVGHMQNIISVICISNAFQVLHTLGCLSMAIISISMCDIHFNS